MRVLVLAGLGLAVPLLVAVPAKAETLDEALALAYAGNPSLKAGRLGVGILDESVAEAVAAWRPNLAASASHGMVSSAYSAGPTVQDAHYPASQTAVQLSQRLFDFGQADNAIKAAEERVKVGRAQLLGNEQNILLTAAQAYMDVLQAEVTIDLNRRNVEILDRQLAAAEAGFQRFLSTRTDVAQAQARRADAQASLEVAQENLDSARAVYQAVIGAPPQGLGFPRSLPLLPTSVDKVSEDALSELPAVQAAERNVEAARADRAGIDAGLLPTVSLSGQSSWSRNASAGYDLAREKKIGIEISVPIYAGGVQQARIRSSVLTLAQRQQELESARREARRAAVSGWNGLLSARARVASFQASAAANEVAYQGAQAEYQRMGTRTLLDVLNAEQEWFTAQVKLTQARRDEVVAAFQVLAASGGLTARKLALPVTLYDPAPHLDRARGNWFGTTTSLVEE